MKETSETAAGCGSSDLECPLISSQYSLSVFSCYSIRSRIQGEHSTDEIFELFAFQDWNVFQNFLKKLWQMFQRPLRIIPFGDHCLWCWESCNYNDIIKHWWQWWCDGDMILLSAHFHLLLSIASLCFLCQRQESHDPAPSSILMSSVRSFQC